MRKQRGEVAVLIMLVVAVLAVATAGFQDWSKAQEPIAQEGQK